MAATTSLPDPTAEPIKLGRGPRHNIKVSISDGGREHNAPTNRFRGTPCGRKPVFQAVALFHATFWTKAEAAAKVKQFLVGMDKENDELRAFFNKHGWRDVHQAIIARTEWKAHTIPLLFWEQLRQRFAKDYLKEFLIPAAFFDFYYHADETRAARDAAHVEALLNERRDVDREAFAVLDSVIRREGAAVETA